MSATPCINNYQGPAVAPNSINFELTVG